MDKNLTAYPRLLIQDDCLSDEAPLPRAFHERFPAHLVSLRTSDTVWPEHSHDAAARQHFVEGQKALYEDKDAVAAMRCYEAAIDCDPEYLQAWMALGIACVTDNSAASLEDAEGIFEQLCELDESSGLSGELRSILRQNLAYLHLHRYRQDGAPEQLELAAREYALADSLADADNERVELLCPWAFALCELGEVEAARALWARAVKATPSREVLLEYAAKYAPLRRFFEGEEQR